MFYAPIKMYVLLKADGTSFYLQNGSQYVVGRINANFILPDNTVSKQHARITVKNRRVILEDLKSSNETCVNGSAIPPNEETEVALGSEIRFGTRESVFVLKKDTLVVATTGLNREQKSVVSDLTVKMSGTIAADWTKQCTHLVANTLVLTQKTLCAMMWKHPIVTVQYFQDRYSCITKSVPLPPVGRYWPRMADDSMHKYIQIDHNADRSRLFKNKTFVFPTTEMRAKMEKVIQMGGGKSIAFDTHPVNREELLGKKTQYVLVATKEFTQSRNDGFGSCVKVVMEDGKRPVPMQEIAVAVLVGHCEKECNPSFDRVGTLLACKEPISLVGQVLAEESQSQKKTESHATCATEVIPDTTDEVDDCIVIEDDDDVPVIGGKRSGAELDKEAAKKFKSEKDTKRAPKGSQMVLSQLGFSLPKSKCVETDSRESTKRKSQDLDDICVKKTKRNPQKPIDAASPFTQKKPPETLSNTSDVAATQNKKTLPPFSVKSSASKNSNPFATVQSKADKKFPNPFVTSTPFNVDITPIRDKNLGQPETEKQITPVRPAKEKPESELQIKKSTRKAKQPSFMDDFIAEAQKDISFLKSKNKSLSGTMIAGMSQNESTSDGKKDARNATADLDSTMFKNVDDVLTSTRIDSNVAVNERAASAVSRNLDSGKWLSRASESTSGKESFKYDETDEQMASYIKMFKVMVVVDQSRVLVERTTQISLGDSTVPNFKKFRKVQPLHQQTTIIPKSSFVKYVCTGDAVANPSDSEDGEEQEDGEELQQSRANVPTVSPRKKFKLCL